MKQKLLSNWKMRLNFYKSDSPVVFALQTSVIWWTAVFYRDYAVVEIYVDDPLIVREKNKQQKERLIGYLRLKHRSSTVRMRRVILLITVSVWFIKNRNIMPVYLLRIYWRTKQKAAPTQMFANRYFTLKQWIPTEIWQEFVIIN